MSTWHQAEEALPEPGYVCARVVLERDYALSTGTLEDFQDRWATSGGGV